MNKNRCAWAKDSLEIEYHDKFWGRPVYGDRTLFERLILEGMQAGLSWLTIIKKKEGMTEAFNNFKPEIIAEYSQEKINELLKDDRIIRNKLKLNALVLNAKAYLKIQEELCSFSNYIWSFVNHKIIHNSFKSIENIPKENAISKVMSKDLKNRGFKFVGPTICYSFMQSTGMVNDHTIDCFCYENIRNI